MIRAEGISSRHLMRPVLAALALTLLVSPIVNADIVGSAVAISGDTIEVEGQRIRLLGVAAPGLGQACTTPRMQWRCGMVAEFKLGERIGSAEVLCQEQGADSLGHILGRCHLGDPETSNLNRWLVAAGWAIAASNHGEEYVADESRAMHDGLGLWKGGFVPSPEWRHTAEYVQDGQSDAVYGCDSCALRHRGLADRKRGSSNE